MPCSNENFIVKQLFFEKMHNNCFSLSYIYFKNYQTSTVRDLFKFEQESIVTKTQQILWNYALFSISDPLFKLYAHTTIKLLWDHNYRILHWVTSLMTLETKIFYYLFIVIIIHFHAPPSKSHCFFAVKRKTLSLRKDFQGGTVSQFYDAIKYWWYLPALYDRIYVNH